MNTRNKKADPKPARQKLKLPSGTGLLAKPENPSKDFKCVRCSYEWITRKKGELPVRCPRCSSPSWNKTRMLARRVWSGDNQGQPAALPSDKQPGMK
jgi:DNA-directed RNA polymerase subunit RPC12/RpoP